MLLGFTLYDLFGREAILWKWSSGRNRNGERARERALGKGNKPDIAPAKSGLKPENDHNLDHTQHKEIWGGEADTNAHNH